MSGKRHYCDYNAGAPLRPEAREMMLRALDLGGNPSSVHGHGRAARAMLEDARECIASGVGARTENLVFTSGATEALHLAMDGAFASGIAKSLIVSAIEHDAVIEYAARKWPGFQRVAATTDGVIDLSALARALEQAEKPALVALMLVNNETGAIQPIRKAAALVREYGGLLLVDAAQAFGRIPVDLGDLDASYLALSSIKIGGPPGAGALALAPGAPFASIRAGGGQERGRRPGTENAPALAGFHGAARAVLGAQSEAERIAALRARFEAGLPADALVFAQKADRVGNVSYFALPGMSAETAVIAMDLEGVSVSSGSACSSGKVRASRVLTAMSAPPDRIKGALRVSFGWASSEDDVDAALAALNMLRARGAPMQGAA